MWQKDRPLQTAPSTCCWKSQHGKWKKKERKAWSPKEELQEWALRNARLTNQWCQQALLIRFLEYWNTVISLWLLKACARLASLQFWRGHGYRGVWEWTRCLWARKDCGLTAFFFSEFWFLFVRSPVQTSSPLPNATETPVVDLQCFCTSSSNS